MTYINADKSHIKGLSFLIKVYAEALKKHKHLTSMSLIEPGLYFNDDTCKSEVTSGNFGCFMNVCIIGLKY